MMSSGSVVVVRRTISLPAASPGTIARDPLWSLMASSRKSRRSLAFRELSSGPWQLKHLLEMRGRIWELKSTGSVTNGFLALAANVAPIEHAANRVKAVVRRARSAILCFMQLLNDDCWQLDNLYQFSLLMQRSHEEPPLSQTPS